MNSNYRVEHSGSQFTVIDPWEEEVGTYTTEDAAKQDIERCKKEDALYEDAQHLIDISVKTLMQMHGVDRQNAIYWIRNAIETKQCS